MANLFQGLSHANLYSQFRPKPPNALIEHIVGYVKSKVNRPLQNAVDIGCGSGQSTLVLAPYFQLVTGFDVSEAQVKHAKENRYAPNVHYRISAAESLDVADSSVDLVTACQALHWFDFPKVFSEIERILVPNGVFAAYGYSIPLPTSENPLKTEMLHQLIVDDLYESQLGKYWSPERKMIDSKYSNIVLPFNDCVRDNTIVKQSVCTISDYIGYLSSWSAYQALLKENPKDAQSLLEDVRKKMMSIIEVNSTPEEANLNLCIDYFILMGSKKDAS